MPYKNIEDKRECYKRWYRRNLAKNRARITAYNEEWRATNRERYLECRRKYERKKRDSRRNEGKCTRCGNDILDDEEELYGETRCQGCNTIAREWNQRRKVGLKLNRVV